MSGERRSTLARLGIVALNLPMPGLGLLRLGRLRPALITWLMPIGTLAALTIFFALAEALKPGGYFAASIVALLVLLTGYLGAMALSWRGSRCRIELPWWSRWYALVGAWLLSSLLTLSLAAGPRAYYRTFYLPSQGMEPTLSKNDRFLASSHRIDRIARGDIIVFRTPNGDYVKRVAALSGDRIAMRSGVPIINGRAAEHTFVGGYVFDGVDGSTEARRLRERLPGETGWHDILDMGLGPLDETSEQLVRQDHLFVLGDNRDQSADSRVPVQQFGVEQVRKADVIGVATYVTTGVDPAKTGRSLSPPRQ